MVRAAKRAPVRRNRGGGDDAEKQPAGAGNDKPLPARGAAAAAAAASANDEDQAQLRQVEALLGKNSKKTGAFFGAVLVHVLGFAAADLSELLPLRRVSHGFDGAALASPRHWQPLLRCLRTLWDVPLRARLLASAEHAPWIVCNLARFHGFDKDEPLPGHSFAEGRRSLLSLAVHAKNGPLIDALAATLRCDVNRAWEANSPLREAAIMLAELRTAAVPDEARTAAAKATFRKVISLSRFGLRDQLEPVVIRTPDLPARADNAGAMMMGGGGDRRFRAAQRPRVVRRAGGGWGQHNNNNNNDDDDDGNGINVERQSTLRWLLWRTSEEVDAEQPVAEVAAARAIADAARRPRRAGADSDDDEEEDEYLAMTEEQKQRSAFFDDMPYIYHHHHAYDDRGPSRAPVPRIPLLGDDGCNIAAVLDAGIGDVDEMDSFGDTMLMRVVRARGACIKEQHEWQEEDPADVDADTLRDRARKPRFNYMPLLRLLAKHTRLCRLPLSESRLRWSVVAEAAQKLDVELLRLLLDEHHFSIAPGYPCNAAQSPPPDPAAPQLQPTDEEYHEDMIGPPPVEHPLKATPEKAKPGADAAAAAAAAAAGGRLVMVHGKDKKGKVVAAVMRERSQCGSGSESQGADDDDSEGRGGWMSDHDGEDDGEEEDNGGEDEDKNGDHAAAASGDEDEEAGGDGESENDDEDDNNDDDPFAAADAAAAAGASEDEDDDDAEDGSADPDGSVDEDDADEDDDDGTDIPSLFHYACDADQDPQHKPTMEVIEILARHEVQWIHSLDADMRQPTPVMRAVATAQTAAEAIPLLRQLVEKCNMWRCIDNEERSELCGQISPLHLAAIIASKDIVQLFVGEYGAAVDVKTMRFANEQTTETATQLHAWLKKNRHAFQDKRKAWLRRLREKAKKAQQAKLKRAALGGDDGENRGRGGRAVRRPRKMALKKRKVKRAGGKWRR